MKGHLRIAGFAPALAAALLAIAILPVAAAALEAPPDPAGVVTLAPVLAPAAVSAQAVQGKNAWFWPTGHDISSSGDSWLQYRKYSDAPAWHVAFDDCDPYRTPVLALTWGTVMEARSDVSGYGPGGTKGGAVVVLYKAAGGQEFKALYGHVQEIKVVAGASVRPGQTLAVLNNYNPPHCHFGINLGREYPSNPDSKYYVGMLMGHTHDYTVVNGTKVPVTYNWVDPIAFLNNNRPFVPPPASLSTPTVPARARSRRAFLVSGIVSPRHRRGTRPVILEVQRSIEGTWTTPITIRGTVWDYGTRSRFRALLRLTEVGRWRVRSHLLPDAAHLEAYSGWREFAIIGRSR